MSRHKILKRAKIVRIVLDSDDYELIRAIASAQRISISEFVRRLIRLYAVPNASTMININSININNINAPLVNNVKKVIKIDIESMTKIIESLNVLKNVIDTSIKDRNTKMRYATAMKHVERLTKLLKSVDDDAVKSIITSLVKTISNDDVDSWEKARSLINELESRLVGEN